MWTRPWRCFCNFTVVDVNRSWTGNLKRCYFVQLLPAFKNPARNPQRLPCYRRGLNDHHHSWSPWDSPILKLYGPLPLQTIRLFILATVMAENYQSLMLGSHKPPEVQFDVSKTAPRSLVNINIQGDGSCHGDCSLYLLLKAKVILRVICGWWHRVRHVKNVWQQYQWKPVESLLADPVGHWCLRWCSSCLLLCRRGLWTPLMTLPLFLCFCVLLHGRSAVWQRTRWRQRLMW